MKRILICLFCLIMIFSGCSIFGPTYYANEEALVFSGIDTTIYQYSGEVRITDSFDYSDTLELRDEAGNFEDEFFDSSYTILDGHFERFAWNDYTLYIVKNNLYYVFDIKNYSFPPCDENGNETYELLMYTDDEFRTLYADCERFDWIDCMTPNDTEADLSIERKWKISRAMPFSLPDNAKLLEFVESTNKNSEDNYIKGKVAICVDKLSEKFIDKIKNEWIKPPLTDSENFEEIIKAFFNEGLIVYSDDYYYFYNDDYSNIFAYDADMMVLYFYISD